MKSKQMTLGTIKVVLAVALWFGGSRPAQAATAKAPAVPNPVLSSFVVDSDGAVLVPDAASDSVYRIVAGGAPEVLIGRSKGLYRPHLLGFEKGTLYVSDERGLFQVVSSSTARTAKQQVTLTQVKTWLVAGPDLPYVKITAPALLTRCVIDTKIQIRWAHNLGRAARFRVELSRDSGESWETLANDVQGTVFVWTATLPQTEAARFRVTEVEQLTPKGRDSAFDVSDDILYVLYPVE